MSLLADYHKETGVKQVIENDWGFITYVISGQECYIEDLYVVPDYRKTLKASQMADQVAEASKLQGCKYLTGSVVLRSKTATQAVLVLISYGFKVVKAENGVIWFIKEI